MQNMNAEPTPLAPNPFVQIAFRMSCPTVSQCPADDAPELAFAGRSNAGKSSALNALCGRKALARVSKTPGRTQLINLFELPSGERLVDLPGYGYAKVSASVRNAWARNVGEYVERRANLVGLVQIMDCRHPLGPLDRQMLDWCLARDLPCHVLLTKADKLKFGAAKTTLLEVQRAFKPLGSGLTVQLFSATSGQGLEEARLSASRLLGMGQSAPED